jgi:hypothetical protein
MLKTIGVIGTQEIKPLETDIISSETTVYVHENIVPINLKNQDGTDGPLAWQYDETQYTKEEWNDLRLNAVETATSEIIDSLAAALEVTI